MAKSNTGDDKRTSTVRIKLDLLNKARTVALWRRQEVSEYVDRILRPNVEKDFDAWLRSVKSES